MSDYTTVECPQCGNNLEIHFWTETHKVHNGIGMQTVDKDHYREISDKPCDCEITDEEWEGMVEDAEDNLREENDPQARNFSPEELGRYRR